MQNEKDLKVMVKQRVLIIGGSGLLGSHLNRTLRGNNSFEIFSPTSKEVNFADFDSVHAYLHSVCPDIVINASGLTNIDYCQIHLQESYLKNVTILENLQIIKNALPFYLVHISTDHCYDAHDKYMASNEGQMIFKNIYALTKRAGELALLNEQSSVVLRTNFFGKSISSKQSFTDWLYSASKANEKIYLFDDITFSPLHISTLISIILKTIEKKIIGIFNTGSREGMSKAEFAKLFLQRVNPQFNNYEVIQSFHLENRTPRPKYMIMDSSKLESALGIKLLTTREEVEKTYGEYL